MGNVGHSRVRRIDFAAGGQRFHVVEKFFRLTKKITTVRDVVFLGVE